MVDLTERLKEIRTLIDDGKYFTINRARQFGKTTTLDALTEYLKDDYIVLSFDFQMIGNAKFAAEHVFTLAFINYLKRIVSSVRRPVSGIDKNLIEDLSVSARAEEWFAFDDLFPVLSDLCDTAKKPVVMIIDEVDSATNNQVFLDFLAQLRAYYLKRRILPTFHSVILAGVTDVKNIRRKIRPDEEHKVNSPWNIASDFNIEMSFSAQEIRGMLIQYEEEHHTGMDTEQLAGLIYDATSGYPFLVSKLCQILDERIAGNGEFSDEKAAWTRKGYLAAEKLLTHENNTLFDSLTGKLADNPGLKKLLHVILFQGRSVSYALGNQAIEEAAMYGFIRNANGNVVVANRIFETVLYDFFLSEEELDNTVYTSGLADKNQFVRGGRLDMKLVLERFVQAFTEVSQGKDEKFLEEEGRKYFMLYLKPIINGTGHSYVEARTRSLKRTDLVVDYHGEQFVIEMKLWKGQKYHSRGEKQTAEYLDFYGLKKGYMLIFNFNKHKETGVREIRCGDRILVEAVV